MAGRRCSYCGSAKQAGLHLYTFTRDADGNLKKLYACRACDPVMTPEEHEIAMKAAADILSDAYATPDTERREEER